MVRTSAGRESETGTTQRPIGFPRKPAGGQSRQGPSFKLRAWCRSNAAVCQSAVPGASPGARPTELWCQQSAQRPFNPHGAGATPAGSTNTYPVVIEGGRRRSLPAPSDLSHGFSHDVPEQRRDRPAKPRFAGASPAVVSTFGVVVIKAARRARNAEETERYRPAPPILSARRSSGRSGLIRHDARRCDSDTRTHFSERSLAARHSAWDRNHACAIHAAPTTFQVRGPVSGAPACDAGEAGATPAHLTNFARGDEAVESALCRREVSRCESDHERQFRAGRPTARTPLPHRGDHGANPCLPTIVE